MTSSPAAEAALPPLDGVATVAGLRERRQVLSAELRRCTHLRRLLRARLDLTVAETLEQLTGRAELAEAADLDQLVPAWPRVPAADVETMVQHVLAATVVDGARGDLVTRLQGLELAMRHLGAHVDALQDDIDDVTAAYVGALGADPTACLAASG